MLASELDTAPFGRESHLRVSNLMTQVLEPTRVQSGALKQVRPSFPCFGTFRLCHWIHVPPFAQSCESVLRVTSLISFPMRTVTRCSWNGFAMRWERTGSFIPPF